MPTRCTPTRGSRWVRRPTRSARKQAFEGFTVDDRLMAMAAPDAVFMHCLPAYRGLEVTADVIDGPQSAVIEQGHNRLPAARAALAFLLGVRRRECRSSSGSGRSPGSSTSARWGTSPSSSSCWRSEGISATQATVSRDLDELGAIKVRVPGGQSVYALPEIETDRLVPFEQLRRVLGEWVAEVGASGEPRRAAHTSGLRPRRRLGARPQRDRRPPRHGCRRRHAVVRRRTEHSRRRPRRPAAGARRAEWRS